MDPIEINDAASLEAWLSGKPSEWAQAIALRAALRSLPYIGVSSYAWLKDFALLPFGAVLTSWVQLTESSIDIFIGSRASARYAGKSFNFSGYKESQVAALAADVSYHSADAQTQSTHVFSDCVQAVGTADNVFLSVAEKREDWGEDYDEALNRLWFNIQLDCLGLSNTTRFHAESALAIERLWSTAQVESLMLSDDSEWLADWQKLSKRLRSVDPNYSVWIDWYERRIRGERAAFDIPGDKGRIEDKKILRRLAEASDEDFWGKGHEYVNATLKGWLDEARENVRPKEVHALQAMDISTGPPEIGQATLEQVVQTPPQVPGAIAYGVNEQGKLDRLPNSDQAHLRDVPDQRRAYDDLRAAVAELLGEGQRLGHRLQRALDRFLHSLPDGFEDAEAYLVWRDANALRRLHRAHREAAKSPEPDEARLEPVIAEGLGGLLDLFNNFAFADDGLRAKDEARIAPQERASAEAEAKAAIPLVEAIIANPEIATPEALDDIVADVENAELPTDDPYAGQVLDQSNRTKRNLFAGLISDTWAAFKNANPLVQGLVVNAAYDGAKLATTVIGGIEYAPLLEFIATNPGLLQHYLAVAFPAFEHLPQLIDRIRLYWLTRSKD